VGLPGLYSILLKGILMIPPPPASPAIELKIFKVGEGWGKFEIGM
jgi:hypothetical protein